MSDLARHLEFVNVFISSEPNSDWEQLACAE
jgi:hypothetical protein